MLRSAGDVVAVPRVDVDQFVARVALPVAICLCPRTLRLRFVLHCCCCTVVTCDLLLVWFGSFWLPVYISLPSGRQATNVRRRRIPSRLWFSCICRAVLAALRVPRIYIMFWALYGQAMDGQRAGERGDVLLAMLSCLRHITPAAAIPPSVLPALSLPPPAAQCCACTPPLPALTPRLPFC